MNDKNNNGKTFPKQEKPKQAKKTRRLQEQDFRISLTGKHVFGAYFNMARTNFVKTINYLLPMVACKARTMDVRC